MKAKRQKKSKATQASRLRHEHEAEAGVAGALAGAAMGGIAGPPGILAGAIIGGAAGAVAALALERGSADESLRNEALDAEIGITGGDLGAPNLDHPPPERGAYSAASGGLAASTDASPAEGPIEVADS